MQLYFIRHGQSANNYLYQTTGSEDGRSCDPELTDLGRRQIECLAKFLNRPARSPSWEGRDSQNVIGFGITHLYTSLMVRAVASGVILAEALQLPLIAWVDLHEGGGIYLKNDQGEPVGQPGKNRVFFDIHYPQLVLSDTFGTQGWWNRPFETVEQRPERARRFVQDLLTRHGGTEDRVAVVSHGGFFNHLLTVLIKLPKREGLWFLMNNAALSRIDINPDWVDVEYLNRVDYLSGELIT